MKIELQKDESIKSVIDYLRNKYDKDFIIKDFWKSDLCAIGLSDIKGEHLIYISTFGLPKGKFNIVLEFLNDDIQNPSLIGEFDKVSLNKLELEFMNHLGIN